MDVFIKGSEGKHHQLDSQGRAERGGGKGKDVQFKKGDNGAGGPSMKRCGVVVFPQNGKKKKTARTRREGLGCGN